MSRVLQDVRYAMRQLRKSPGFTVVVVASLTLAIGVNTTIFSYANRMLYARMGVPRPGELRLLSIRGDEHMLVKGVMGNGSIGAKDSYADSFSFAAYQELRKRNTVLQDLVAFNESDQMPLSVNGETRMSPVEYVSGNFYSQMELRPELGRGIGPSDDGEPGSGMVVVLSDRFWHREFGGLRDAVGRVIRVGGQPATIVGVNPPQYTSAQAGGVAPDVILPLSMVSVLNPDKGEFSRTGPDLWWLHLMGRAKPGVEDAKAQAALTVAMDGAVRATMTVHQGDTLPRVIVQEGSHGNNFGIGYFKKPIYILTGLAGLVLLLACANTANLLLARAVVRQREMGVRMALGGSRARVMRQLMTESLLLAALGGGCGLFLGYLSRNVVPALTVSSWRGGEVVVPFDWRVFGFTAAITLGTGLIFGLAPAWRATRVDINTTLKEGNRSATRSRRSVSGKALVVFQVMLSAVLVMSSALFLRTMAKLDAVDPGFRVKGLTLFSVSLPTNDYPAEKQVATQHRIEEALQAVPGVEGATASSMPFIGWYGFSGSVYVEGSSSTKTNKQDDQANSADVGGSFFSTMGIPMLAGRSLNDHDTETSPKVAVINKALADRLFPNANAIGKRFRGSNDPKYAAPWIEIVGVCGNTHYQNLREETPRILFTPFRQDKDMGWATYMVRSELPMTTLLPALRHAVQQVDANLPLREVRTQQEQIEETMQQERMFAAMTTVFGSLALLLACIGIYGIMAYTVSQRRNEIGIRLALGAWREQIRGMVLQEAAVIAGLGVVLGLGSTLLLVKLVQTMLYGVKPRDPASLLGSSLLLLCVALLASAIPAARAAAIDPMEALRDE